MQTVRQSEIEEFQLETRNQSLFARCWKPEGTTTAIVLLIHGYAEHSGRYYHVAKSLLTINCIVYGFDLTGHGRSPGLPAFIDRFDNYVDEAEDALTFIRQKHSDLPIFLLGHSMGGLIATYLALRKQNILRGLITSGGALKVNEDLSPFLVKISGILGAIAPKMPAIKLSSDLISRDPEVVEKYDHDPLIYHGGTRCRTGAELIKASRRIDANFDQLILPLLILHGGADKLTDPQGSKQLYQSAASKDKKLQIFEELRHEIFNEPEQKEVLKVVVDWISDRQS